MQKFLRTSILKEEHLRRAASDYFAIYYTCSALIHFTIHKQFRSNHPKVFLEKHVLKICSKFTGRTPMPKCDFNKVAKELYWNLTSTWAFSCKYAAYFQNTFSSEHLWRAASVGVYQHNFPAITVSVTRCFNSNWISFQSFTLVRIFLYWDWIRRFTP